MIKAKRSQLFVKAFSVTEWVFNIERNSFIALRVEIIGVVGIDSAGGLVPINFCTDTVVQNICYRV